MSRSASAAPRSPATVENRANISQLLPTWLKISAFVYRVMSRVTRSVPKAPAPLACMRRSGMTSRSKWASFSISHRSCSRAGPRGPAVRMFKLSVTGVPVACVRYWGFFSSDIVMLLRGSACRGAWRLGAGFSDRSSDVSTSPGRPADDAAKVDAMGMRLLVRDDVGLDVAEGRLGLVANAGVEGLNDLFLEAIGARMRVD